MKQLISTLALLLFMASSFAQPIPTPLAIVTGFNEGGPDGVAIALTENFPAGTRIYLTTEEYQVGQFKFGDNTTGTVDEFVGYWESPTQVPEGMVIAISETAPNVFSIECNHSGWFTFGVDCGSFTHVSGDFDINQEQEIYLYSDNDSDPGNGITRMHSAIYINFAGNQAFPAANNPGTPTGDWPYTFDVDSLPSVANPAKRFLNMKDAGRFTNHFRVPMGRPSFWDDHDSFLGITKLDTGRFLEIHMEYCSFSTDVDGDLICDFDPQNVGWYTPDNCINTPNPDQADADGDGIGDVCDNDNDNDGVVDAIDNCPSTFNPGQEDLDGDGIGDVCDDCSVIVNYVTNVVNESCDGANDGKFTLVAAGGSGTWDFSNDNGATWQSQTGSDGYPFINLSSGAFNVKVRDANNPTCISSTDVFILANNGPCDTDGDGINDVSDNCPSIANPGQEDTDNDGMGDACDDDDDNDGVLDVNDNCPLEVNLGQEDNDLDNIGDICDDDDDNDGVIDINDNCSLEANPGQEDNDLDNIGDACDDDDDNDGILDINDNCSLVANPGQEDNDLDNIGDICDDDDDNDGILDINDNCPLEANAGQEDIDSDGIGDVCDNSLDAGTVIQNAISTMNGSNMVKGQKKSMANRLKNARKAYCKDGDTVEATAKLNQFIVKVQGPPNSGKLSPAEEQLLIESAQAMISAMNDGTFDCSNAPRIAFDDQSISMTLFPNPTQGQLNVHFELPNQERAVISILDVTGRTVFYKEVQEGEEKVKIDLDENLADGQYFVKLNTQSDQAVKKFILSR